MTTVLGVMSLKCLYLHTHFCKIDARITISIDSNGDFVKADSQYQTCLIIIGELVYYCYWPSGYGPLEMDLSLETT